MEIGNQIKNLRLRRGITQEAMAQHFGITPQAISKWERGVTTPDNRPASGYFCILWGTPG